MPLLNSHKQHAAPDKVNFAAIASAALSNCVPLLSSLLPDGRLEGREWVARNPTRNDKSKGSFRVNVNTGKWSDFATDDRGGDLTSLAAYINRSNQIDAAQWLSRNSPISIQSKCSIRVDDKQ